MAFVFLDSRRRRSEDLTRRRRAPAPSFCRPCRSAVSVKPFHRQCTAMAKNETPEEKEARKDAKKQAKADRRAKREGLLVSGTKPCDLCHASKDLLIRYAALYLCIPLLPCVRTACTWDHDSNSAAQPAPGHANFVVLSVSCLHPRSGIEFALCAGNINMF
jgi:hypothetical protein